MKSGLKKGKEIQVTHQVDYTKLETVLSDLKSGKTTIAQTMSEVDNLYEATARFQSLNHSQLALELSGRHIDMIAEIVDEQHRDFQQLIKVIEKVVAKK